MLGGQKVAIENLLNLIQFADTNDSVSKFPAAYPALETSGL